MVPIDLDLQQNFVDSSHPQFDPDNCYLTYYSDASSEIQVIEPERSDLDSTIDKTMGQVLQRDQKCQVVLSVKIGNQLVHIISRRGAFCISLGLSDYSSDLSVNQTLGNLAFQFQDPEKGGTYVSIIHRTVVGQLRGCVEAIYQSWGGKPPRKVYLRITSTPGSKSIVSNIQPNDNEGVRYRDITSVPADFKGCQLTGVSVHLQS